MKVRKMKVSLCTFDISRVGGITTVKKELRKGLESLGHTVTDCRLSPNSKTLPEPEGFDKVFGFVTQKFMNDFKSFMSDQDLLIFTHPCPTITKAFSDPSWK